MVEPARHIARLLAGRGQPVYQFRLRYDVKEDIVMEFTNDGPVVRQDPWATRLDLVERAYGSE